MNADHAKASEAVKAALKGHEPSDEQKKAITHETEPVAIIAGAGSGKTAIMAARMVWMVEKSKVEASQILGLTFTNKAAGELEERIARAFEKVNPTPPELPTVATYNSFADRLVRDFGVRIGIDPEVGLLSQGQSLQLMLKALAKIEPFEAIDSRSLSSISARALSLADQCDNHLLTPEQVAEEDRRTLEEEERFYDERALNACRSRIELAGLVRAYMTEKQAAGRIDYGDQVSKAVEILKRFPGVAAELRDRYPAILLDEYQDTNVAQRLMLEILAPEGSNVTAVGDARQNIFQWRGSTLFNLLDFPTRHFLRAGGATHNYLSLSHNFRSGSAILDAANKVIEPVPEDRRPGEPLSPQEVNGEGFVGTRILEDQYKEAQFIADEIGKLHGTQTKPGRPDLAWNDFAILVRRKSHMGAIYSALRDAGIPVEVIGLAGLLQVPEVVDAVSWLRVISDPGPANNRWLARILLGPHFRVHYRDLAVLARWASRRTKELADAKRQSTPLSDSAVDDETDFEPDEVAFSLAEILSHVEEIEELADDARERLLIARNHLNELADSATKPLLGLVQEVIIKAGIGDALRMGPEGNDGARFGNLTQFIGVVANFSPVTGESSLSEFLEFLDAAEDADDSMELEVSPADDSVKLTTVHRAKGLEFEVVFVPGVAARENKDGVKVDSIFPDERTSRPMTSYDLLPYGVREDARHLPVPWTLDDSGKKTWKKQAQFTQELKERAVEDERRLFYVALTRAKQRLYVTCAWWYERHRDPRGPSMFFDEVKAVPSSENLGEAVPPPDSPLRAQLEIKASWPPDPPNNLVHFEELPEGLPMALDALISGQMRAADLLDRLRFEDRAEAERLVAEYRKTSQALVEAEAAGEVVVPGTRSLSATQAVSLAAGTTTLEELARPLPQRSSPAARIGTEVHRWIEEKARGLTGLVDEDSFDAPPAYLEESKLWTLKKQFANSEYQNKTFAKLESGEPMAEVPFVLKVGDRLVRGRIDAVYEQDGDYEVVDYKSGGRVDPSDTDQLLIYAGALSKLGFSPRRSFKLTYLYLGSAEADSRTVTEAEALTALSQLERVLNSPS